MKVLLWVAVLWLSGCVYDSRTLETMRDCNPAARPGDGVFVSSAAGDDQSEGTMATPFASIARALAAARGRGGSLIYLDQGVYPEAVQMLDTPAGIFLEGGWVLKNGAWSPDCGLDAFTRAVIAPGSENVAVKAAGVVHASGLRHLTVSTKQAGNTPTDASGESLLGVFVHGDGSLFSLVDVAILAANAGDGGTASAGAEGSSGAAAGTCSPCQTGAAGAPRAEVGLPATLPGSFASVGYLPADGAPGLPGVPGENGTAGTAGVSGLCVNGCSLANGWCPCNSTGESTRTGGAGACGCGGEAGGAGSAGRGGGASVALLVVGNGASVTVEGGRLKAGDGGAGSAGGQGGNGGPGSPGADGSGVTCCTACQDGGTCSWLPPNCGEGSCYTLSGGAAGSTGGDGGQGAGGGAGGGGPSFAVVRVGGAVVAVSPTTRVVFGSGGKPGDDAAAPGAEGAELVVP